MLLYFKYEYVCCVVCSWLSKGIDDLGAIRGSGAATLRKIRQCLMIWLTAAMANGHQHAARISGRPHPSIWVREHNFAKCV